MARKLKLGLDIDATVWDDFEWFKQSLQSQGVEVLFDPHSQTYWSQYHDTYGPTTANRMFEEALDPERVAGRVLYEGCEEAIRKIRLWGIEIVVISHNHDPDKMVPHLTPWVRQKFGSKTKVCVLESSEAKIDVLQAIGAFGIIDDRPSTLEDVADAGLLAIGKKYKYNEEVLARPDVYSFDRWNEVPDLVWQYFQSLKQEQA